MHCRIYGWDRLQLMYNLRVWDRKGQIKIGEKYFIWKWASTKLYRQLRTRRALSLFNNVSLRTRRALSLFNDVPLRTRGHYHYSMMFHWEPERCYCHRLYTAIVPFWFSKEHHWIVITPFWLSIDNMMEYDGRKMEYSSCMQFMDIREGRESRNRFEEVYEKMTKHRNIWGRKLD